VLVFVHVHVLVHVFKTNRFDEPNE